MRATARALIGRTIVAVDFRPFDPSPDPAIRRGKAHNPVLTLDNGRRVWFVTEETEVSDYGTDIQISAPVKKGGRK